MTSEIERTEETWNPVTQEWDTFEDINFVTFQGFNGHVLVVPIAAENPEAAWSLISYLAAPEVRAQAMTEGYLGVDPSSYSQLEAVDKWVEAGMDEESAMGYLAMIRDALENPNSIADLRLPGFAQYQDAIELAVSLALSGQATPQEALDQAATEWNNITERIGREQQLQLYRESLGLE